MPKITRVCQHCGITFDGVPTFTTGERIYCGRDCYHSHRSKTLSSRFWEKVDVIDDPTSCWKWKGRRKDHPKYKTFCYGLFDMAVDTGTKQVQRRAHRVSYLLSFGPFDSALHVLHKCDNPPCVRPSHLFLGTQADNMHDKDAKGRGRIHR